MTPDDIARIETATNHLPTVADDFADFFYRTLFELAPETRQLFADDMAAQRTKLFDELEALVELGIDLAGGADRFTDRAHQLGHRHLDYDVEAHHYEPVGDALLVALAEYVPDWGPEDRSAWARLYRLVANTMLEGTQPGVVVTD